AFFEFYARLACSDKTSPPRTPLKPVLVSFTSNAPQAGTIIAIALKTKDYSASRLFGEYPMLSVVSS
ncbi:hypothetical protein, partial [uncultured Varibaculum sp.]|uniref:hypothetical protein n=1 Tax=uncultured Varibaculum sp. TaxID=413896 RepID=UPI0025951EFB